MTPSRPKRHLRPGAAINRARRAPTRWVLPGVIVALYALAGLLNGRELLTGGRPSAVGMAASAFYVVAWLSHAVQSGLRRSSGDLRRMAAFWAVVIAGTWLCSTFVRLNLGSGAATPGGWVVPSMLLALAAPVYGLVGPFASDPHAALVTVTIGGAVLTMAFAVAARKLSALAPDRGGVSRG